MEEDLISQPLEIGKYSIQTASKNSLWEKNLSVNHSSTVDPAITLSKITGISTLMMAHGVLIQTLILTKTVRISRLLFKISTSHCFEQFPHYPQYQPVLFLQYPNQKSKGTNYCSSNSYYSLQSGHFTVAVGGKAFHPSESRILP